ncbi:hypothetical protein RND81_09G133700 [Saponaria officinalis]|uniref:Serine carboxypeptidase-like 18 n=1 Tax=Saponaria officinalis TaxID=3572 RepID=A0AAW1IME7_SAPOF
MALATPLIFLLLTTLSYAAVSRETVSHLPGFPGKLPFNLETGYVSVGDAEMFYYFVESEDNPRLDPLMLWLTGGPGCSSWNGLVYEIGPLEFDLDHSLTEGGFPRLRSYEYAWTKTASIIFLDSPVGTGFSYSTTQEGWPSSDTKAANEAYQFLLKWLEEHPQYLQIPLYLGGDAYSGIIVPLLTKLVAEGNEAGEQPYLNLKGYLVGSPNTDEFLDSNSKIQFAHRMALISDKNYDALRNSCNENYINVDPNNTDCVLALDTYERCVNGIWENHILEPKCSLGSPQDDRWNRRSLVEDDNEFLLSTPHLSRLLCRNFNYTLSETLLNDKSVQKALHIREGTVKRWSRCNKTISYTKDRPSVVGVHRDLAKYELNVLVTTGDRDMVVPFVAVVDWINILKKSLKLTLAEYWRPWFVDAQVGGYTRKFEKKPFYSLTYATVKGGGHTAAEYYRKECYEMFNRWVNYFPL